MRRSLLLAAACAALGCAGQREAVDASAAAAQSDTLVVLERSGGFAGEMARLVVLRSGSAALATRSSPAERSWSVPRALTDSLTALLVRPEFSALAASYRPENPCCDRFTFVLTVPAAAGHAARRIETVEGASHPEALERVLALLRSVETAGDTAQTTSRD